MNWRRNWHRRRIAGRSINWYWGTVGSYSYGWRWFRRNDLVTNPPNWTGNFGRLHISIWGRRLARGGA